jgi:flavin-dependent dehydrogenase
MKSVLVIGGGPAGASFAARMSELGNSVVLVERLAFPRRALGESLTPGVRPLVAAMGADRAVAAAGFPAARDVRMMWEEDSFAMVKSGSDGLLVDRGRFDAILLSHAAREGVRVLQPAEVVELKRSGGGWRVVVSHGGASETLDVDFLADARGRAGLAGSAKRPMGEKSLALYGYWRGHSLPQEAAVAAGASGWFWGIPLPDGSYNAQAFVSPRDFHKGAAQPISERYRALIAASPLAEGLSVAELESPVRAIDATPYLADEPVSETMIRLGDAALSLDPLSSSGVQKAIQSALSGAIVANTILQRPSRAAAALSFYQDSLARTAARHAQWTGEHYASAARTRKDPFWTARAVPVQEPPMTASPSGPHELLRLSPQARLVDCPCLGAEFVEVQRALVHPGLDGPVAYLERQALAPLLSVLPVQARLMDIVAGWAPSLPPAAGLAIAAWLRRKGVLVPVSPHGQDAAA